MLCGTNSSRCAAWCMILLLAARLAASQPVEPDTDVLMALIMAPPPPPHTQQQSAGVSVGTANPKPPAPPVAAAAINHYLTCYIPTNITSGPLRLCSVAASAIFSQTPAYSGFPILPVCAKYQHQCISIDLLSLHNATVCSPADVANGTWKWMYQVVPNMDSCKSLGLSTGNKDLTCCAASLCNAPSSYVDRNTTVTGRPCNLTAAVMNVSGMASALGR